MFHYFYLLATLKRFFFFFYSTIKLLFRIKDQNQVNYGSTRRKIYKRKIPLNKYNIIISIWLNGNLLFNLCVNNNF